MTAQNVSTQQSGQDMQGADARRMVLLPPTDIVENAEGIRLIADLPGVGKENLGVRVDGNTLTFEGEAKFEMPSGLESQYAEIRSAYYQRSFTLSRELDTNKIEAKLKDGVLNLLIPKREESKPRRIDVKVK